MNRRPLKNAHLHLLISEKTRTPQTSKMTKMENWPGWGESRGGRRAETEGCLAQKKGMAAYILKATRL